MKNQLPDGYSSLTGLPPEDKRTEWQQENRAWWEANPMRYDWKDRLGVAEFSRECYQEIDRRFFADAAHYMPRIDLTDYAVGSTRTRLELFGLPGRVERADA